MNMTKIFFVTGISTDVGKTIASAIICESLKADYWKPIQAGDIDHGDSHTVEDLLSNTKSVIHPNAYSLNQAMSPHAAAELDGVNILSEKIKTPITNNDLVIEGAGGLMVPINNCDTMIDLIQKNWHVVVVSKHYLGSINHSLMTIKLLQHKGFHISVIFNGEENQASESIIRDMTNVRVIGRIDNEVNINKNIIKKYAKQFHTTLKD